MQSIDDWKGYAKIAIVLGSGLNQCIHEFMNITGEISYQEIEGMKVSTAPGHVGKFLFGTIDGIPVVAMQGRLHGRCYHAYCNVAQAWSGNLDCYQRFRRH